LPVALIAKKSYPYGGRRLAVGETFLASPKDAELLKVTGLAVDAPPSRLVRSRDLVPEPDAPISASDSPKPKRQYRRRDLVPEP
jgi:hypothetical protein